MRLSIRYLTKYTYGVEVGESQNALRACPANDGSQRLLDYRLTIDPPTDVVSYTDYWGTRVDIFGINERHTRLSIFADSDVETTLPAHPLDDPDLITEDGYSDLTKDYEYRTRSPHVQWSPELRDWAREITADASGPYEIAVAVHEAVGSRMSYVPDATEVGTPVLEIFETNQGVCQDYAHLSIAACRSIGIPARYVSGYFYATPTGEQPTGDKIEVETHAWIEVALPGFGWWALDPTNQLIAGERHVKIGHGRDYEDVTPLRGVFHGDPESTDLHVGVVMSRKDLGNPVVEPRPSALMTQQQQQQQQQ
ncbi:MAG: transglutaminase family protein [Acidimicrobiia bacterium]|nr:transglutaminase family protein [Acidimicrobiia bacterium]NNL28725.1 transglutaminase family protein [Acidimicrobiia bacterium]